MESPTSISHPGNFRVDEIRAENAGEMCHLFENIFGKPMSAACWQWKYPLSGGHGVGVWDGDELVAHYGGAGVEVVFEGKLVHAVQICDVMVSPKVRHAVRKHSPMFVAASTFIERFVGYGQEFLLGFGFPSNRALHLAEHLRLYEVVGTMSELSFPAVTSRLSDWLYGWRQIEPDSVAACADTLDALWQQMQASMPAAVLVNKNAARVNYRFVQHPHHRYHLWLLRQRLTGQVLTAVVLKEEPEQILLMDLIGSQAHFATALRQLALAVKRRWTQPLVFWLSSVHAEQLQIAGMQRQALPISTPANIWTKGPAPAALMNRWWLTAGDTDFL